MIYYIFSVINTLFVPCTALLYDSIAATRNNKIVNNSIEHFLCSPYDFFSDDVLSCLWIIFTNCFSGTPSENSQVGWDLGNRMTRCYRFDVKWVCPMRSNALGIQVICARWWFEMSWCLVFRTEHLNTSGITSHRTDSFHVKPITPGHLIPKISTRLTICWGGTWKTEFLKATHRQERTSSENKSGWLHKKCSIELWTILLFEMLLIQQRSASSEHSIYY